MEIKASAKYERASPRKLRLLTKGLTGLSVGKALEKLEFHSQKGKELLIKVIKQALANAKNNFKINEDLVIKSIEIGDGPSFKRIDKSHGARFDQGMIKKKTAHVFLTLETKPPFVTPSADFGRGKKEKPKLEEKLLPVKPKAEAKKEVKRKVISN